MPTPRVITTPTDLAKYVGRILGPNWRICVDETKSTWVAPYAHSKMHEWKLFVILREPLVIHVSISAKTFPSLVKAVDNELWEKIRAEFDKQSVQWQRPGQPDVIEKTQRRVGVKPREIARKQAALPHKSLALTHRPQGQQLLLLPPQPDVPCCNWPGCTAALKSKAWACFDHWYRLPQRLQDAISRTYRPGQRCASSEYLEVIDEVRSWIETNHPE